MLDVVAAAYCAGCGNVGQAWCHRCQELMQPTPSQVRDLSDVGCPVWSGQKYHGVAIPMMVALKERHQHSLLAQVALLLDSALMSSGMLTRPIALMPVPSTRRANRQRGIPLVTEMSRLVARRARRRGHAVVVADVLRLGHAHRDQAGLTAGQRRENMSGSAHVVPKWVYLTRPVVVVDDIVTTGSTLQSCVRAASAHGLAVEGAISALKTPRRMMINA